MMKEKYKKSMVDRFWQRTKICLPNECWLWKGQLHRQGYGILKVTLSFKNSKDLYAHRVSWMIHFSDPGKLHVLHKCDNPRCVNPNHLFVGSHKDNMKDMYTKNRRIAVNGEKHGGVKLTENEVVSIKQKIIDGHKLVDIAKEYNVTAALISRIKAGKAWKQTQE